MKNKFLLFSVSLIFLFIFTIFYRGLQDTNIYSPEVKINTKIPSFSAELFYSNKIVNSFEIFDLNKYYLLNIWSSWCVPCRQEHPLLIDLAKNKNVKVFGINYKDNKDKAEKFLKELGNPFHVILSDLDGTKSIFLGAYGVPETLILDSELTIKKKYIGPINSKIVDEIRNLAK